MRSHLVHTPDVDDRGPVDAQKRAGVELPLNITEPDAHEVIPARGPDAHVVAVGAHPFDVGYGDEGHAAAVGDGEPLGKSRRLRISGSGLREQGTKARCFSATSTGGELVS